MFTCYYCDSTIIYNVYKAYDLNFCSNNCRNCIIIEKQEKKPLLKKKSKSYAKLHSDDIEKKIKNLNCNKKYNRSCSMIIYMINIIQSFNININQEYVDANL